MKKVRSIEFRNNPIFGSQKVSLTRNADDRPYDNIVLIGENGAGKTLLLKTIHKLLSDKSYTLARHTTPQIIARIDVTDNELVSPATDMDDSHVIDNLIITKYNEGQEITFCSGGYKYENVNIDGESERLLSYEVGGEMSEVDINFTAQRSIRNVTNTNVDSLNVDPKSTDIAATIEQLLVDIYNQDNNRIAQYARKNPNKIVKDALDNQVMRRFTNAYNYLFGDSLILDGVDDNINIMFEKSGKRINIHDLSSGEKQIVYRSAFLLRNIGILNGAPIFIDEPEISMHPKWEKSIYEYYKSLFTSEGKQTSQMFFATHSDYIISQAINDDNALILVVKDGIISRIDKGSTALPLTTSAGIKYHVFGIPNTDYHIQLYGYIAQNLTKSANISKIDKYLLENNATRKESNHGKTRYHTLTTLIRNDLHHPDGPQKFKEEELEKSIQDMIRIIGETKRSSSAK